MQAIKWQWDSIVRQRKPLISSPRQPWPPIPGHSIVRTLHGIIFMDYLFMHVDMNFIALLKTLLASGLILIFIFFLHSTLFAVEFSYRKGHKKA